MDLKRTEQLLEKWYDGNTSPEEERELKKLLQRPGLPESLAPDRELLLGLDKAADSQLSDPGFDDRVFDAIEKQIRTRSLSARMFWKLSAAALVLIILFASLIWHFTQPDDESPPLTYTQEEIREAGDITMTTLFFVSDLLNTGDSELSRVSVVTKNLEKLEYLSAISRGIHHLEIISNQEHSQPKQENES